VALRPRLSPGVPLSWDCNSELQSGAEAFKRPARGSMRVSSGNVRTRKQHARTGGTPFSDSVQARPHRAAARDRYTEHN
jgi:hypothetical protein